MILRRRDGAPGLHRDALPHDFGNSAILWMISGGNGAAGLKLNPSSLFRRQSISMETVPARKPGSATVRQVVSIAPEPVGFPQNGLQVTFELVQFLREALSLCLKASHDWHGGGFGFLRISRETSFFAPK